MYDPKLAHELAIVSQEAYQDSEEIISRGNTQVLIRKEWDKTIIAFRGTEADVAKDWLSDANIAKRTFHNKLVHAGFLRAYKLVRQDVLRALVVVPKGIQVHITGHSLGAALATLCAFDLARMGVPVDCVYTYGTPRVGGGSFKTAYDQLLKPITFRHVHHNDLVCKIPTLLRWRHIGELVYFDEDGDRAKGPSFWKRLREAFKSIVSFDIQDLFQDHAIEHYIRITGEY